MSEHSHIFRMVECDRVVDVLVCYVKDCDERREEPCQYESDLYKPKLPPYY